MTTEKQFEQLRSIVVLETIRAYRRNNDIAATFAITGMISGLALSRSITLEQQDGLENARQEAIRLCEKLDGNE